MFAQTAKKYYESMRLYNTPFLHWSNIDCSTFGSIWIYNKYCTLYIYGFGWRFSAWMNCGSYGKLKCFVGFQSLFFSLLHFFIIQHFEEDKSAKQCFFSIILLLFLPLYDRVFVSVWFESDRVIGWLFPCIPPNACNR